MLADDHLWLNGHARYMYAWVYPILPSNFPPSGLKLWTVFGKVSKEPNSIATDKNLQGYAKL